MDMIEIENTKSIIIFLCGYTDDLRATWRPQRATDGLSSARKQEP